MTMLCRNGHRTAGSVVSRQCVSLELTLVLGALLGAGSPVRGSLLSGRHARLFSRNMEDAEAFVKTRIAAACTEWIEE